ncbi:IS3 family transposase [Paenibacillus alvei]|uniref:IS3 family transposase n=1 Tax=Paenibacillus alvei TaxID=44250 RepID=UPI004032D04B
MVTIMPLWRASSRISKRKGSILHIRSLDEAQRQIEEYIHFYNHNQPQRKLKKLPPVGD